MEMIKDDKNFRKFLTVCLDAGNILNTGNKRRGNSYGFAISSLKSFFSCKSSIKRNFPLIEFVLIKI